MKIKVTLTIGYSGADQNDELDVPDDWTDEQIMEEVGEWADQYVEYWYEKVRD